jgi:hypothetical protein
MNFLRKYIFSIILMIILITWAVIDFRKAMLRDAKLQKEWPILQKGKAIEGKITFVYDFVANGSRDLVSLSRIIVNDTKYGIIADEIEEVDRVYKLGVNSIVRVGDHIYKKANNDTIVVTKKSGKSYKLLRRDQLYD